MRAMFLAAGLTVSFTLFGCGQNQQQAQVPAAAPVAAVAPPACNCSQATQTASTAAGVRHHRHRYRAWRENSYSSQDSSSSSTGEYSQSDQDDADSSEVETHVRAAQSQQGSGVWVDGYGRQHYADYGPPDDEDPGHIARADEHRRMRPWRGYDSKCDNQID